MVHHSPMTAPLQSRLRIGLPVSIPLRDGRLALWPDAFAFPEADRLLARLRAQLPWAQETLVIFGRERLVPRLVSWHGDPGTQYRYSGRLHQSAPWTPALLAVRQRVESLAGCGFNSVLANLYRDGRDGMGWHADDEPELGPEPLIASLSLGATRRFRLRHRRGGAALTLELTHGSLLLMSGPLQRHWVHCVPKTARPVGPRINLTFRSIVTPQRGRP